MTRFDIIVDSYESALAEFPNARTDANWLIRELHLQPTDSVLEIAGGTGYLTERIVRFIPQGKIIIQDISKRTLEVNRQKNMGFGNIEFYTTENMKFPELEPRSLDKIVCLGGFHHIEDQVQTLKTAYKLLRDGGICCVGDFADESNVQRYFDEMVHKLTETGHHGLFPSYSNMLNLGRFAGFSKIHVERVDVPFKFDTTESIGVFYQKVHALKQNASKTLKDIKRYFEIRRTEKEIEVMMPYVYAKYIK